MKIYESMIFRCLEDDCEENFQVSHTNHSLQLEVCPFCGGDIDYAYSSVIDQFIDEQLGKSEGS